MENTDNFRILELYGVNALVCFEKDYIYFFFDQKTSTTYLLSEKGNTITVLNNGEKNDKDFSVDIDETVSFTPRDSPTWETLLKTHMETSKPLLLVKGVAKMNPDQIKQKTPAYIRLPASINTLHVKGKCHVSVRCTDNMTQNRVKHESLLCHADFNSSVTVIGYNLKMDLLATNNSVIKQFLPIGQKSSLYADTTPITFSTDMTSIITISTRKKISYRITGIELETKMIKERIIQLREAMQKKTASRSEDIDTNYSTILKYRVLTINLATEGFWVEVIPIIAGSIEESKGNVFLLAENESNGETRRVLSFPFDYNCRRSEVGRIQKLERIPPGSGSDSAKRKSESDCVSAYNPKKRIIREDKG